MSDARRLPAAGLILLLALAAIVPGCQRTQVTGSPALDHEPGDTAAEMAFWHDLADRQLTSNNEALHGLIAFAEGSDPNRTYEERVKWLTQRGWLAEDFAGAADEVAERGTIASILAHALNIKGGLTMRLVGPHPRYAVRELVHLGIMPPSSAQQGLSGIEFVGIIGRAEEYLEGTL